MDSGTDNSEDSTKSPTGLFRPGFFISANSAIVSVSLETVKNVAETEVC